MTLNGDATLAVIFSIFFMSVLSGCGSISTSIVQPDLPEDNLDTWLKERESKIPGIKPGTEKTIIWAGDPNKKTQFSIIYIHGFSANRKETAPVFDRLAEKLGANIFYTRLKGHGRGSYAMKNATFNDWLNEVWEAWEIGKRIGEEVIVVGMSTGAPLVSWLSTQVTGIKALILLSPNFGLADKRSNMILGFGGRIITRIIAGKYMSFKALNDLHK